METPTPFELNQTIHRWRESLSAHATLSRDDLEELESHLHNSMAMLQGQGLSAEEAFHIAARRLGPPTDLAEEFGVVNQGIVWRQRAFWMLAGMLFWALGKGIISICDSGAVLAGSWFTTNGLLLGWLGSGLHLLLLVTIIVTFWQLANGRFAGLSKLGGQLRQHHPARFIAVVVIGMTLLSLASGGLTGLTYHRLDPITIGQQFQVNAWFSGPISLLQLAALVGGLVWLSRRRPEPSSQSHLATWLWIASAVIGLSLSPAVAQEHGNTNHVVTPKPASATMDEAMKLWRDGKQDEAVEKFLAVDFSMRPLFPTGSVLNMTEVEFINLPQAARDKMSKGMMEDIQTIKRIAGRVNETTKAALAAKDQTKADHCLRQLKAAGDAFDRPGGLALLKLIGQALKKMAAAHQ